MVRFVILHSVTVLLLFAETFKVDKRFCDVLKGQIVSKVHTVLLVNTGGVAIYFPAFDRRLFM